VKIQGIPVEVLAVTLKMRDGQPHVVAKIRADIARGTGSAALRSIVQSHVVPRPELLAEVSLEGLDDRDRGDLSDEEAARLDKLIRRRNAKVKLSCAAPSEWWDGVTVALRPDGGAEPAMVLRPAKAEGRVVVETSGDFASVTMQWACLTALVKADPMDALGVLLAEGVEADIESDSMQLDLFAEGADAVADAARSFVRTVRDAGASARIEVPGRVVELFPENAKPDDDRLN